MVELGATVLLFILKMIFSAKNKKKLSDKEFVSHIRAHQLRRAGVGQTATDFESSLKNLPEGTQVQVRYVNRFPKFWKRHMYDLRIAGISRMSYSQHQLSEKQIEIWKITGIMSGMYLILVVLGLVSKPRRR